MLITKDLSIFSFVGRDLLQVGERRIARAEIVDRDANPQLRAAP
jgi:hypothetical protein